MKSREFLYSIKITECPFIRFNYSMIAQFCLRNIIETLGELIDKYQNNEVIVKNKKSIEEMDGFIDLINYFYLGERMPKEHLLFDEIIIVKDSWNGNYWKGRHEVDFNNTEFINPLKRLGFNVDEADSILSYVNKKNYDMTIISALINYKEEGYKWFSGSTNINYENIIRKIDILVDYYNKFLKTDNYLEQYKTLELEELLKEYDKKRKEYLDIVSQLKLIRETIVNKEKYVSNENIKKLEKSYNFNSRKK